MAAHPEVKDLFLSARELSLDERQQFLDTHCPVGTPLRGRVEALLVADAEAGLRSVATTSGAPRSRDDHAVQFNALQRALAGRFSVEREIGRGGMGIVYLARDVALNRAVAVKLLPPEMTTRPEARERFLREVRTAAGMTHPNIVPIHLVDDQGGLVCFVMSFVDGETLRQQVERAGPLPPPDAARVMQEVAWALAHAHARGIVHRDVKPDNILIERGTGRVLVTDFGIAATLEQGGELSSEGQFLGTPLFTSPEQAAGLGVDPRSDLYSLGATMFFALTGRAVFASRSAAEALVRHISEPPPGIGTLRSDLPPVLTEAVNRCLAKDPAERFQTAEELARTLGPAAAPEAVPEPLRRLVADVEYVTTDLGGLLVYCIAVAAGWWLDRWSADAVVAELTPFIMVVTLLVGGTFFVSRAVEATAAARDAARRGFSPADVRRAMGGPIPPQGRPADPRWSGVLLHAGTTLTVVCWVWDHYAPLPDPPGAWDDAVWAVGLLGPLIVGRLAIRQALRRDLTGRGWMRRASTLVGSAIVRIGRWGAPHRTMPSVEAAPTETLLVGSADALLGQLPPATQAHLAAVPDLMRRLQQHAKALRARQAELERALSEAGSPDGRPPVAPPGSTAGRLRTQMEAARQQLAEALQETTTRLADVLSALEVVRLGLLKLRAGVATPADLTGDLALAVEIGAQVDALLQAHREAEEAAGDA